jgi:Ni/Fe-hydrogenase subunit HybB-like protein
MRSSTSRHASFDRAKLGLLLTGIVGAPLVWLTALQTGYVLAYQACDDRSVSWVVVPTLIAVTLAGGLAAVSIRARRRSRGDRAPMPLLGWMALLMSVLMFIVLGASAIGPFILRPCD